MSASSPLSRYRTTRQPESSRPFSRLTGAILRRTTAGSCCLPLREHASPRKDASYAKEPAAGQAEQCSLARYPVDYQTECCESAVPLCGAALRRLHMLHDLECLVPFICKPRATRLIEIVLNLMRGHRRLFPPDCPPYTASGEMPSRHGRQIAWLPRFRDNRSTE